MTIINEFEQKSERYLPHKLNTKYYYTVILYRNGNRPLQLIDCQNIFCELDKYCR